MGAFTLYFVLLKATIISFSGFGSLPQVREDLVIRRQAVTDETLNRAVLVARATPGPMGVYIVSVGYEAAGWPGVVAGWLAMATPALLVLPLCGFASRFMHHRRVRGAISALVLASAVLIVVSGVPLGAEIVNRWIELVK